MARVATIEAVLSLDATQWDRTLKRSTARLKRMATDSRAIAAGVGVLLTGAAAGLGRLSQELFDSGNNALKLRKDLDAAFDGFELEKVTQQVRELGATPPYSEEQFAAAAKAFKAFGGDADSINKDLVRAGNLAAKTGGSFDTLSKAVASFGIRAESTNQLKEVANIDAAKLAEFGAVLDETGTKLDFTGENVNKAREALRALLDAEYAGAMDEVVTATDKLAGSFGLLKEDAGAALTEIGEGVATYLIPLVEGLREMPAPLKAAAGGAVLLAGAAASVGASIIAVGLALPAFQAGLAALPAASTVAAASAVALGGAIRGLASILGKTFSFLFSVPGALAAAAVGLHLYTEEIKFQTQAQEDLLAIELARAKNQRGVNDLLGKSAKQLQAEGKTAEDLANGMLALQERIQAAREAGNNNLEQRLRNQVVELKAAKEELAKAEQLQREREAAEVAFNTPEAKKKREEAAADLKKQREKEAREAAAARQEQLDAELDGIELRLAKEEITVQESLKLRAAALEKFQADEDKKRALAIETARTEKTLADQNAAAAEKAAKDKQAQAEEVRRSALQAKQDSIDLAKASGTLSVQDELDSIQEILRNYKLNQDERVAYKRKAAALETQIAQEEADKQKAIDNELLAEQQKTRDLQRDAIGDEIDRLQKQTEDTGKDNSGAIQAAIQQSLALQVESIRAEAERSKAAASGASVREQIERNAQLQIQDAIRETEQTEKSAIEAQKSALDSLNEKRKEVAREATGLGKDPYGIEDLNESIQASLNVQATTGAGTGVAATQALPTSAQVTGSNTNTPFNPVSTIDAGGQSRIDGEIRFEIDVNGPGELKDVQTAGLDGRFSEITRNSRGMRGSLRIK